MATGLKAGFYVGKGDSLATAKFTTADKIAHLTSIGEQKLTVDETETTDLDCIDGFKTFEPGMADNGSISLTGNLAGNGYSTLKALTVRNENGSYKVLPFAIAHPTLSDVNIKFMGWISEIGPGEMTPADTITFSATVRISGATEDFEEPTA